MKSYKDFNRAKRAETRNEFGKDLYKFFNLSVFGKTMENTREHRDIKLCNCLRLSQMKT